MILATQKLARLAKMMASLIKTIVMETLYTISKDIAIAIALPPMTKFAPLARMTASFIRTTAMEIRYINKVTAAQLTS